MYRLRVAWAAALSGVVPVAFAGWSLAQPSPDTGAELPSGRWVFEVVGVAGSGLVWAVVGAVLVTLRPRNVLGWLVLGPGLGAGLGLRPAVLRLPGRCGRVARGPGRRRSPGTSSTGSASTSRSRFCSCSTRTAGCSARGGAGSSTAVVVVSPVQIDYWMIEETAGQVVANVAVLLWIGTTLTAWAGAVARLVRARPPQRQQQALLRAPRWPDTALLTSRAPWCRCELGG